MCVIAFSATAQGKWISGRVTDTAGQPVVGATVTVEGSQRGVITDPNGGYRIQGSENAVLVFQCLGYERTEVKVGSKDVVNVEMQESTHRLDDVIVTGYQTISKERATGSFGTVTREKLESKLNSDLKNMLEGQVAGVVLDKDGNLSIRGRATLQAETSPLVVVDGYPTEISLSDLNPDNIENITVLKDGVAASIYGSRSANGVIVVTTKGGFEGKARVSYRGTFKFESRPDLNYLHMAPTSDYIDAELALHELNPSGNNITSYSLNISDVNYLISLHKAGMLSDDQFNSQANALRGNNVLRDMEKYMFRTAFTHMHNIGIAGGSDKNKYNLAVNYTGNRSSYINTDDNRLLVDLKNEWTPWKFVTIGVAANINYARSNMPNTAWQTLTDMGSYLKPYTRLVDDAGNLTDIRTFSYATSELYKQYPDFKDHSYNPITDAYQDYTATQSFSTRFNGFLRFTIIKGLTAEVGGNWQRGYSIRKNVAEAESYKMRLAYNHTTSESDPTTHYVPEGDMINETRSTNENWTVRTQITFNREFGKHRVSALLGNEVRRVTFDNNTYETRLGYNRTAGSFTPVNMMDLKNGKYSQDMVYGNNISGSLVYGSYAVRDNRFVSWYFNGSYEFDNRYIISGSVREDLTNFFGTDPANRYKPMWSVGGTWKVNNEHFFDVDWINRLNVRLSYGVNGNISLSEGPFLILSTGSYSSITGGVSYGISSYPNNSLRWEKTKTTNVGLDFDVLDNRLGFTFDYYMKKSSDLLARDAVDPTTGTSSMTKNVGKINNSGIELGLHATPVKTRSFRWDLNYNVAFNKNEVIEYNVSRLYTTSWAYTTPVHAAGYPMYGLFGYRFAGLNDQGVTMVYKADGTTCPASQATVDDIIYQGSAVPKVDMSFGSNFTYKNWDLSFMFIAKLGHKYRKDVFQGSNINSRYVSQRWQKPGDEAHTIYPYLSSWNMDIFYFPFADVNVGNASYMKLRDLTLSYKFDRKLVSRIGMSDVRLYLQARNLFRVTAKGCDIDPETFEINFTGGMGATTNAGYSVLPMNPEYYIGVSFSF